MNTIVRKRIEQLQPYFLNDAGTKRIARTKQFKATQITSQIEKNTLPEKQQRKLETAEKYIACVLLAKNGQLDSHDRELLYVAHAISQTYDNCAVLAIVFGDTQQALADWGADSILSINYNILNHYQPELMLKFLHQAIADFKPEHMFFADNDWGGGELLRRLASEYTDDDSATDVLEITSHSLIRHTDNQQQQATRNLPLLIGLKAEVSETELDLVCQLIDDKRQELQQANTSSIYKVSANDIALEQAELVISLGNGVADSQAFLACAEALGASVGGSRVVVDEGKLTRDRQVGATGKSTSASVYLAFGISGAVQHLEGIKNCNRVIAINTDDSCAMVRRADESYINDAVEVLNQLRAIATQQSDQAQ